MCLAIPAKVLSKTESTAIIDFGEGTKREVNISLVDVDIGNYVIVHAGFAIQVMDEEEANESLKIWNSILEKG
jgi:hydrogenase expression/formation protein HypC